MSPRARVIAIGNFDGLHLGHQRILARARELAEELGAEPAAFTFYPHPREVLRGERVERLLTREERRRAFVEFGIQDFIEQDATREFLAQTPREFVEHYLIDRLGAQAIVVGWDFAFGRDRAGRVDQLREFAQARGVRAEVIPALEVDGAPISSSRIRSAVSAGDMRAAAELLGRPYYLEGVVVHGDGKGRTIGFATANLEAPSKLLPPRGVYVTEVTIAGEATPRRAVTNVGIRPTVSGAGELKIESHLLDFARDLYGAHVRVGFLARLREERKFSSLEVLREQITRDVAGARAYPVKS